MRRKILEFSVVSFASFCFFTAVFNTAAIAMTADNNSGQTNQQTDVSPTPTIFTLPTSTPTPTLTPTVIPTETPTPLPTSTPTPIPTIAVITDLETLFQKYSDEYHVDKELLKRIARCESGFNSQADTGLYAGMFQFAAQTWIATRAEMGFDTNPDLRKNAEESIRTAAFKISRGGQNAWRNCL